MCRSILMVVLLMSWPVSPAYSAEAEKQPLRVLYLARDMDTERQEAYMSFLEANFAEVSMVSRSEFQPVQAQDANVVIVDWSQHEPRQEVYRSPPLPCMRWFADFMFGVKAIFRILATCA